MSLIVGNRKVIHMSEKSPMVSCADRLAEGYPNGGMRVSWQVATPGAILRGARNLGMCWQVFRFKRKITLMHTAATLRANAAVAKACQIQRAAAAPLSSGRGVEGDGRLRRRTMDGVDHRFKQH